MTVCDIAPAEEPAMNQEFHEIISLSSHINMWLI